MWDNCLLCSKSTTVPPNDPRTTLIQTLKTSSLIKLQHQQTLAEWPLSKGVCVLNEKTNHSLTPVSAATPRERHSAFPGLGMLEVVQESASALPSRTTWTASRPSWGGPPDWCHHPDSSSWGTTWSKRRHLWVFFAWLHASQGTCVHLKIQFCFQMPVLGSR